MTETGKIDGTPLVNALTCNIFSEGRSPVVEVGTDESKCREGLRVTYESEIEVGARKKVLGILPERVQKANPRRLPMSLGVISSQSLVGMV